MTIKQQIDSRIKCYKEDFFKETGFDLVAIPMIILPQIPIYDLVRLTACFFEIDQDILIAKGKSKKGTVTILQMLSSVAFKMGFSVAEVSKMIEKDRSTIWHHKSTHALKMVSGGQHYRYKFYQYLEYIYQNYETSFKIDTNKEWHNRITTYDTIFSE